MEGEIFTFESYSYLMKGMRVWTKSDVRLKRCSQRINVLIIGGVWVCRCVFSPSVMQVKWLTGSLYLYFTGYAWEGDKEGKGGGSLFSFAVSSEVPADVDTPPLPQ